MCLWIEEWLDVNDITEKDLTEQEILELKQYNDELAASRRSGFNREGPPDMQLYNTLSCNRGLIEPVKCKKPSEGHWEYPCYDKGKCYRRDCEEDEDGVFPN